MTASASDYLDRWFETDVLKATMSASGIIGTFLGISSPGTAYVLLHHYMGEIDGAARSWGFQRGGMGAVADALANAARSFGAEIRTNAGVERILTSGGRAAGVVLEGGEEVYADQVGSSLDPQRTFLRLLDADELPGDFVRDIRRYRLRGSSGKVNLALDALPDFTALPGVGPHLRGAISISPDRETMERAYDDAKYGRFSRSPYLDVLIPSMIDPSMAPPGKHVMSIFVQYAPYHLNGEDGDWDAQRDAFGDTVIRTLAEYAPNLENIILERQVLTRSTSSAAPGSPRATSSKANSGSNSSSSCVRRRAGPSSTPRSADSSSAAPAPTRAAGSWARPGNWAPTPCSRPPERSDPSGLIRLV